MLTRRTIIATPAAAAAWVLTARWDRAGAQAGTPLVRHSVASPEGKAMLKTYAQAVKIMKASSTRLPRSWTFQWYIHASPQSKASEIARVYGRAASTNRTLAQAVWSTCQAHISPPENEAFFLPWHRLYIAHFEEIVRTLTKTPGFTLPYWDYTNPASAALPVEFRSPHDPVFAPLYMANRNRDDGQQYANVNAGEPINKYTQGAENILNLSDMTSRNYSGDTGFNQRLDGNLHGNIHTYVGNQSNMGNIPDAAGDPIFWLHHCNVDRIWAGWAAAGGKNPSDAAWLDKVFTFADGNGNRASAAVRTIADYTALPYSYDALPPSPVSRAPLIALAPRTESPPDAGAPAGAPPPPPAVAPATEVAQGQPTAKTTAPIALGAGPKSVTLTPTAPAFALHSLAASPGTDAGQRFFLTLRGVQAKVLPGTQYKIYLDLPAGASAAVAADHFVGILNFFDKVTTGPHAAMAMGGKSVAFDITDVVQKLHLRDALANDTAVTLMPTGKPNPAALPLIKDGIEIRHE